MTRHARQAEISPGLPILDELGDALNRDFVRQERSGRRRRRGAIGALAGTLAALVATTVALVGDDIDQARAVQVAAGHTAHATWQLVLADSDDGPCLQLMPREGTDGENGPCATPHGGQATSSVARTNLAGQSFVYGFTDAATSAVRVRSAGQTEHVATEPLPPQARQLHIVPPHIRVFIAPVPGHRNAAVTVEPQGPGNSDLVLRVPSPSR